MRTFKNHGVIAVFVVALSIVSVGEAQATKNDGRFQQSSEARRQQFCNDLQDAYNTNMDYYNEKPSKRSQWKNTAENLKILAEGNNCSWAA